MQSRKVKLPVGEHLVKLCYYYLLKKTIEELQKKNCYGCEQDHPSQRQHLDGCLQEFDDAVERYFDVAVLEVKAKDVEELCARVLEFANQPVEEAIIVFTEDITAVDGLAYAEIKRGLLKENEFEKLMMNMAEKI